jgi:hypothetical protein
MSNITFFSDLEHPRLNYVISVLNFHFAPHIIVLETANSEDLATDLPCIYYTQKPPAKGIWIKNNSLITNNNALSNPIVHRHEAIPIVFPTEEDNAFPLDLPTAIFWMLSRWEEYQSEHQDTHGRFPATESVAYKHNFLEIPVVDQWVNLLRLKLSEIYPFLVFPTPKASKIRTMDVDFAWRYKHQSLPAIFKSIIRDLWIGKPGMALHGLKVFAGIKSDPYDIYRLMAKEKAILFFPLGIKSTFDKNFSRDNKAYQFLIQSWMAKYPGGIHPSYASATNTGLLRDEISAFERITNARPIRSRQHFLKLNLPGSYRNLIQCGIHEDWSMGYADKPGFRAGTSYPFHWYDIEMELETSLMIFPTIIMDVTLRHYLGLSAEQAREKIHILWESMSPTGGFFITLWHNNSLSGYDPEWKNWDKIHSLGDEFGLNDSDQPSDYDSKSATHLAIKT